MPVVSRSQNLLGKSEGLAASVAGNQGKVMALYFLEIIRLIEHKF